MNPPANWYPDPTDRHGQRYWDGEQWTEHVFTDGVQGVDPLEVAAPQDDATAGDDAPVGDDAPAGEEAPAEETAVDEPVAADPLDDTDADDADDAPEPSAADDASGLFDDASGQDAWTPQDGGTDDDAVVAPDMEPADVVASLDEVGEGEGGEVAPAADAAGPAGVGDMSDAFVLAPETASRIVKRRTAEAAAETEPTTDTQPAEATAPADVPTNADEDAAISEPPAAAPMPAPSTTTAPAAADGGLGISGDLLGGAFAERSEAGPVALQNSRLLRCAVTPGEAVVARQGTMVAYQGEVSFDRQGAGGVTRALKRAATGEGLAMMRVEGNGDVFFADGAQHVFLLELSAGPGLSVNGRNVLAFSAALAWDIERVKGATLLAGGLFNTTFTGTGWVALVSDGEPVVLHTDEGATNVDVNALVAWSAGLSTRIVNSVSAKSLVGLGSGEAFQMAFDGQGIVIVQPSEGPLGGAAAT